MTSFFEVNVVSTNTPLIQENCEGGNFSGSPEDGQSIFSNATNFEVDTGGTNVCNNAEPQDTHAEELGRMPSSSETCDDRFFISYRNIRSLELHADEVINDNAHVHRITEADIAEHDVPSLNTRFKNHHSKLFFGQTTQISKTSSRRKGKRVAIGGRSCRRRSRS